MCRRGTASLLTVLLITFAYFLTPGAGKRVSAQQTDFLEARRHRAAGQKLLEKGFYDEALKEAEEALRLDPEFPQALLLKSNALVGVFKKKYASSSGINNKPEVFLLLKESAASLDQYLRLVPYAVDAEALREALEGLRAYGQLADPDDSSRTVFRWGETTVKVQFLKRPEPTFTEAARKAKVRGTVVLLTILAEDGRVKHPMIISTVGYGLTESVLAAVSETTFVPATKDGRTVSSIIQMEYNFSTF